MHFREWLLNESTYDLYGDAMKDYEAYLKDRNPSAQDRLIKTVWTLAHKYCVQHRMCRQYGTEDFAQEISKKVLLQIANDSRPHPQAFARWLKVMMTNLSIDLAKKSKPLVGNIPDVSDRDTRDADELKQHMLHHVMSLSEPHRTVAIMHYYEGMSISQIAERLSVPAGSVKRWLNELRNTLRKAA